MKRVDERDVMLSRIRYKKGDGMYEEYYSRHPELKEIDDTLREMPNINGEGTATYDEVLSPFADSAFELMEGFMHLCGKEASREKIDLDPEFITNQLKKFARYLGADDVGVVELVEEDYYSYRGRQPEQYGKKVEAKYKYGLVLLKEMNKDMINRAPQLEEMFEVTKAYMGLAVMGMWLQNYIGNIGYEARNNMDMNYLAPLPSLGERAGLGERGRTGLLIHPKFGMRVRLGMVMTNLELIPDKKKKLGIKEFCVACNKCSKSCPGKAISNENPEDRNWSIKQEGCMRIWKSVGTDCGVCMSMCPFTQELPEEKVELIKQGGDKIKEVLRWYDEQYSGRPYIIQKLELVDKEK